MRRALLLAAALAALGAEPALADRWVATWGAPSIAAFPVTSNVLDAATTADDEHTFRLLARLTLGGRAVRVRLSNAVGPTPITVAAASAGLAAGPRTAALVPGSSRRLTFAGAPAVTVPPGATVLSDPVELSVADGADLAVSLYLPAAPTPAVHAEAWRTNFVTPRGAGDATADEQGTPFSLGTTTIPVLDGVDVLAPDDARAIVALGDSLTDGLGTTPDGHDRWTDVLPGRLRAAGLRRSVVNAGISGNNVDCALGLPTDGPDAAQRLDRDVLERPGVRTVVVWLGTNDLANACTADRLRGTLRALVGRLRAGGARVVGATIIPRHDARFGARMEADRRTVNGWIREGQVFDAVLDLDAVVRTAGGRLDPRYDSGDRIHLNPAGHRRIAESVDLAVLDPTAVPVACESRTVLLRIPAGLRRLRVLAAGRRLPTARRTRTTVRVRAVPPTVLTVRGTRRDGRPFRRRVRVAGCRPQ